MATEKTWRCMNCQMIIKVNSPYPPDKKAGGACPKSSKGEHSWTPKS